MSEDNKNVMILKQEGFFFNAYNNDALLLNRFLDYKLYWQNNSFKTGFPVSGKDLIIDKLNRLSIDYDIIDGHRELIYSKRNINNRYKKITPTVSDFFAVGIQVQISDPEDDDLEKEKELLEKSELITSVLKALSEGIDFYTGEPLTNMSTELKEVCFQIYLNEIEKCK